MPACSDARKEVYTSVHVYHALSHGNKLPRSSEQPPNLLEKLCLKLDIRTPQNLLPRSAALLVCHLQITAKTLV